MWHCELCERKTENDTKRCDSCTKRSVRVDKEIKRRLASKRKPH